MLYADKYNLSVIHTGQTVIFNVDGISVLSVDITDTNLVDLIRESAK